MTTEGEGILMYSEGMLEEASWLLDSGLQPNTNSASRSIGYELVCTFVQLMRHCCPRVGTCYTIYTGQPYNLYSVKVNRVPFILILKLLDHYVMFSTVVCVNVSTLEVSRSSLL